MQLNPYYHIEIINNQFTIKENFLRPKTRNYGLKTLKKVTDILIHDLPYSSHLAHDRHYESDMQQKKVVLRRIAGQILENFQEKLKQLKKSKSPFKRNWIKLFGVNRQEKKIQHVYQKILKLSESASLPDLPYPS